jgi:hypothetical protein
MRSACGYFTSRKVGNPGGQPPLSSRRFSEPFFEKPLALSVIVSFIAAEQQSKTGNSWKLTANGEHSQLAESARVSSL